ncbi:MAG: hypothetical protein CVV47_07825 [Spirochaetae bacterium HGW-Spirochaetae-3]|jgi:hypothetical protein|nr:MAG: hypothetical protein CVV47_07825 [Spirochaetae bacterium HGW-Spirochaetae-3]
MKRIVIIVALLAAAGMAFAQATSEPTAEGEALGLLLRQTTMLRLSVRDYDAASGAFQVMTRAGIMVRNAYRLVSEGLDGGLRAEDMIQLAEKVRLRSEHGFGPAECENAAREMIRERVRMYVAEADAALSADQDKDQDRDRLRDQLQDGTCDQEPDQDQDRTRDRLGADPSGSTEKGK